VLRCISGLAAGVFNLVLALSKLQHPLAATHGHTNGLYLESVEASESLSVLQCVAVCCNTLCLESVQGLCLYNESAKTLR